MSIPQNYTEVAKILTRLQKRLKKFNPKFQVFQFSETLTPTYEEPNPTQILKYPGITDIFYYGPSRTDAKNMVTVHLYNNNEKFHPVFRENALDITHYLPNAHQVPEDPVLVGGPPGAVKVRSNVMQFSYDDWNKILDQFEDYPIIEGEISLESWDDFSKDTPTYVVPKVLVDFRDLRGKTIILIGKPPKGYSSKDLQRIFKNFKITIVTKFSSDVDVAFYDSSDKNITDATKFKQLTRAGLFAFAYKDVITSIEFFKSLPGDPALVEKILGKESYSMKTNAFFKSAFKPQDPLLDYFAVLYTGKSYWDKSGDHQELFGKIKREFIDKRKVNKPSLKVFDALIKIQSGIFLDGLSNDYTSEISLLTKDSKKVLDSFIGSKIELTKFLRALKLYKDDWESIEDDAIEDEDERQFLLNQIQSTLGDLSKDINPVIDAAVLAVKDEVGIEIEDKNNKKKSSAAISQDLLLKESNDFVENEVEIDSTSYQYTGADKSAFDELAYYFIDKEAAKFFNHFLTNKKVASLNDEERENISFLMDSLNTAMSSAFENSLHFKTKVSL